MRAVFRAELRRLWRSPVHWALVALSALLPIVALARSPGPEPVLQRYMGMADLWLPALTLLLSLYAGWSVEELRRAHVDETVLAWPVASWRLEGARTLALATVSLAVWLAGSLVWSGEALLSYWHAAGAAAHLPESSRLYGVGELLARWPVLGLADAGRISLQLLASSLGAQVIGQTIGTLAPGLIGLALIGLIRAVLLIVPVTVNESLHTRTWTYLLDPDLNRFSAGTQPYWPLAGMTIHTVAISDHALAWVVGSTALLLLLTLIRRAGRDRARGQGWRRTLAAMGALGMTGLAVIPFMAQASAQASSQAKAQAAYGLQRRLPPGESSDPPAWAVPTRYVLDVDLRRPPQAVVRASVTLRPGETAAPPVLTLRRWLTVEEVRVDGHLLPPSSWQRQGDQILLPVAPLRAAGWPRRPLRLELRYRGAIDDWRLDATAKPVALLRRDLVLLPWSWGWYPVPGKRTLTTEIALPTYPYRALIERGDPFFFGWPTWEVGVRLPERIFSLVGFWRAGDGSWRYEGRSGGVSLLGGRWATVRTGAADYTVPLESIAGWRARTARVDGLLARAEALIAAPPVQVVFTPVQSGSLTFGMVPAPNGPGLWLDAGYLLGGSPGLPPLTHRVLASLVPDFPATNPPADRSLDAAYRAVFQQIEQEFSSSGTTPARGSQPAGAGSGTALEAAWAKKVKLWAARTPEARRRAELAALFRTARERPLTAKDFAFLNGPGSGAP